MKKKFLVMGLPGSGKTYLSKKLSDKLNAIWLNADEIRKKLNDWDFSLEGRLRQSKRMKNMADEYVKDGKNVIADFICPVEETRKNFNADYIIWVDTIKKGRFEDTNLLFDPPKKFDFRVTSQDAEFWSEKILENLKEKGFI